MSQDEAQFRAQVFSGLKKALKARGLVYADLAERLGVSEPTVKRLFQDQDCKLSRLMEVCDALDLPLSEALAFAQDQPLDYAEISPRVEQALAENPSLFAFFTLLISNHRPEDIASVYGLSEPRIFLLLRQLEKLELIELGEEGKVRLLCKTPVRWDKRGPLFRELQRVNLVFLGIVMEGLSRRDDCHFATISRFMHARTAERFAKELDEVHEKYARQAQQDQIFHPVEDLVGMKWVSGLGPFMPTKLFEIEP